MIRKYNTDTKALGRIRNDFDGLFLDTNEVKLKVIINEYPSATENQRVEQVETIDLDKLEWKVSYNVIDLTDLEIALRDWEGGDLEIKVIAPIEMVLTEFGVKMKGWFELLGLPIISKGETVHLYCNQIDEQFKETVDDLVNKGVLKIEKRPK